MIAMVKSCASCDAVSENVDVPLEPIDDWLNQPAPPETVPPLPATGAIAIVTVRYLLLPVSEKVDVPLEPVDTCCLYPAPPEQARLPELLWSIVIAVWSLRPGLSTVTSPSSKPPILKIRQSAVVVVTAGLLGDEWVPPSVAD